ncbi:hypothetical protein [Burkholderia sp. Bp8990]|uniref:hypothetical protein n=1 Tax=Burkholderia sp. Bp8990 TaxID=2184552 RepID=UPI000F598FD9|nr:hypothetical protein [Burkholderia sp. Bp8990]RQS46146.1 hypothetical protein DIE01_00165 [Burkholderia sp. Bp8990]
MDRVETRAERIGIGPNIDMISTRVLLGGPAFAKRQVLQEANTYCSLQDGAILLHHEQPGKSALHGGYCEAEIAFDRLQAGEPMLKRPASRAMRQMALCRTR